MALIDRVVTSQEVGAVDSPTELVDNNGSEGLGPYQLLVTPGRAEVAAAEMRLYDADRAEMIVDIDDDANLLMRFDAPFDGPVQITIGVVPAGRKLWIATPDDSTSEHRATLDRVDIAAI